MRIDGGWSRLPPPVRAWSARVQRFETCPRGPWPVPATGRGWSGQVRFVAALAQPGLGAIAEFKRRSPSMGDIRPDARVEDILPAYERGGASAISVLVDDRFGGSIDDLRAARATTNLPLLAKGFFSTEEQLRELREAGADAVLLILRDLDDEALQK